MFEVEMLETKEAVSVLPSQDGQPVAFIWRGVQYLASSRPVRWYSRRSWWVDFDSVARGVGAVALEVEIWRLRASCETHSALFELEHLAPEDDWNLLRVVET